MVTKLSRATEVANLWKIEHDKRVRENQTLRAVFVRARQLHEVLSDLELSNYLCKTDSVQVGTHLDLLKQSLDAALFATVPGENPFLLDVPTSMEGDGGKIIDH